MYSTKLCLHTSAKGGSPHPLLSKTIQTGRTICFLSAGQHSNSPELIIPTLKPTVWTQGNKNQFKPCKPHPWQWTPVVHWNLEIIITWSQVDFIAYHKYSVVQVQWKSCLQQHHKYIDFGHTQKQITHLAKIKDCKKTFVKNTISKHAHGNAKRWSRAFHCWGRTRILQVGSEIGGYRKVAVRRLIKTLIVNLLHNC